jgi:hypothetical protein
MTIDAPSANEQIEMNRFQSANCGAVVGDTSRHPARADEVHREERQVEGDERRPEVELPERSLYIRPVIFGNQ